MSVVIAVESTVVVVGPRLHRVDRAGELDRCAVRGLITGDVGTGGCGCLGLPGAEERGAERRTAHGESTWAALFFVGLPPLCRTLLPFYEEGTMGL